MKKRALVLCTANCIRSQIAEGLWNELAREEWECFSAGVSPSGYVHPMVEKIMHEIGIDISKQYSKSVEDFRGQKFDAVVTVCGSADQSCPNFFEATTKVHWPTPDPTRESEPERRLQAFRAIRDGLREQIIRFISK